MPEARKRKRHDYKRAQRSKAMELWQMDIVDGVMIRDAPDAKIVSGLDDHLEAPMSAVLHPTWKSGTAVCMKLILTSA